MAEKVWQKYKQQLDAERTMHKATKEELENQRARVRELEKMLSQQRRHTIREHKACILAENTLADFQTAIQEKANEIKALTRRRNS